MATRWLVRSTLGILISLGMATTALAQGYGGGGTGGGTGGTGAYSSTGKSYGSGTAIAVGGGVAAAVVIGVLVYRHHHAAQSQQASVAGCTDRSAGGVTLTDENSNITYSLNSLSKDVKSGERVELAGKKSQDASGKNLFQVQKLVRDVGSCNPQTASAGAGANP